MQRAGLEDPGEIEMPLLAREVMQTQVITLSPDDPLVTVERLFFEEEIHGAPVVGEDGRVLGMISSLDLLRAAAEAHDTLRTDSGSSGYVRELFEFSEMGPVDTSEDFRDRLGEQVVSDVMSDGAVAVSPETPVSEVARTLREHRTHRVLVTDGGRLCGIISTFDLIGLLEKAT
jgi:CBS domain-containing protein